MIYWIGELEITAGGETWKKSIIIKTKEDESSAPRRVWNQKFSDGTWDVQTTAKNNKIELVDIVPVSGEDQETACRIMGLYGYMDVVEEE